MALFIMPSLVPAHSVAVNVPMSQEALEDADNEDSGLSASGLVHYSILMHVVHT